MLVPKKVERVKMCTDFRDIDNASRKDDFHWPHIDISVKNNANDALLSFVDEYAGYNQVKMGEEDIEKSIFNTPWGTYSYKIMSFGLNNTEATCHRTTPSLPHELLYKEE